MFIVIVYIDTDQLKIYEFLEDSIIAARERAEEVAQKGFWIEGQKPLQLVPPSRIKRVQIRSRRN